MEHNKMRSRNVLLPILALGDFLTYAEENNDFEIFTEKIEALENQVDFYKLELEKLKENLPEKGYPNVINL